MKITLFYSWQSDLEPKKNRNFIESSINKVKKDIIKNIDEITSIDIEKDSRSEIGTPDLANTIFSKINECDIFIADISIINNDSSGRLVPNPNVLIELGYAVKNLGWSKVICIYNSEFAPVEKLPFDIRSRKPIIYNTSNDLKNEKNKLNNLIYKAIEEIILNKYLDNEEYLSTKLKIDLKILELAFDYTRMIFSEGSPRKILDSNVEVISNQIKEKIFLGFKIYKNLTIHIDELIDFFKDDLETYFLQEKEKRLIAKMVFALRKYKDIIYSENIFINKGKNNKYKLASQDQGKDIQNIILLEPLKDNEAIVRDSGKFLKKDFEKLLFNYTLREESIFSFSKSIYNIVSIANEWIDITGKDFFC